MANRDQDWGLYFHIPFCEHRCNYCDFFTTENLGQDKIETYFTYLHKEIECFTKNKSNKNIKVKTVYIGGGTPSYAPEKHIVKLLSAVNQKFEIDDAAEITIEVNPHSAMEHKLKAYYSCGINRISMGAQSFDAKELRFLERVHSNEDVLRTVAFARDHGIENISIDLIFGFPKQTLASWWSTLNYIGSIAPQHISAYTLMLEKGTRLTNQVNSGMLFMPDDETIVTMFETLIDRLSTMGYEQYEISNFAKDGYQSLHNSNYWKRLPYKGFGTSAHSFENSMRTWNTTSFDSYYEQLDNEKLPVAGSEEIDLLKEINEEIILGLRMMDGIDLKEFKRKFAGNISALFKKKVEKLLSLSSDTQHLFYDESSIKLTKSGIIVADKIMSSLLFEENEILP